MAAQLFRHPSIRNRVGLALVKVLVVEDEEAGPRGSGNGGVALRNFCSWQQLFNPASQRHPEHYDTAVLFTREVSGRPPGSGGQGVKGSPGAGGQEVEDVWVRGWSRLAARSCPRWRGRR